MPAGSASAVCRARTMCPGPKKDELPPGPLSATMNTTIFNTLSHTDFLRLTLEAFSRQGFEVERSSDAGADAVLVSKSGGRIAVLCKKYRDAFIGRPVLQQFHAAMHRIGCKEGY